MPLVLLGEVYALCLSHPTVLDVPLTLSRFPFLRTCTQG
jgi:hypothetical protein